MCDLYGVTRGGYYSWRNRPPSLRSLEDQSILEEIQEVFDESEQTYGSPRVYKELHRRGCGVGKGRVERLMRENALKACSATMYRGGARMLRYQDQLDSDAHNADLKEIDQVWVGDVTYLKVNGERRYLATVMDKYSRRVLGWSFGKNRTTDLTRRALVKALRVRKPASALYFHSDRGPEYIAGCYRKKLKKHGFTPSVNRRRTMNDNAHMESWYKTMKTELYHRWSFSSDGQLIHAMRNYIEYYNTRRLHSSLQYRTPMEIEAIFNQ